MNIKLESKKKLQKACEYQRAADSNREQQREQQRERRREEVLANQSSGASRMRPRVRVIARMATGESSKDGGGSRE